MDSPSDKIKSKKLEVFGGSLEDEKYIKILKIEKSVWNG